MKVLFRASVAASFFVAAAALAQPAKDLPGPPGEAAAVAATLAGEPHVRRTVVEDDSTRIEELRVRGQLQRIVVSPKGKAPSYEIIVGDGSRDLSEGANTSRGAAGKRVWNVLRF